MRTTLFSVGRGVLIAGTLAMAALPCRSAAGQPAFRAQASQPAIPGHSAIPDHDADDNGATGGMSPAEILSDTQGVNFNPYLHRILRTIYDRWISLLPEDARAPKRLSGRTLIRFTIQPDGEVSAMHLDGSTHEDSLNRAAWAAIATSANFPALPQEFHGPNLELRIHFEVNEQDTGSH